MRLALQSRDLGGSQPCTSTVMSYTELGASDAWKAILPCDVAINLGSRLEDVLFHFGMGNWRHKVDKEGAVVDVEDERYKKLLKDEKRYRNQALGTKQRPNFGNFGKIRNSH